MVKNGTYWGAFILLVLLGSGHPCYSQDLDDFEPTQVGRVRFGPHPEYTRILINLDKGVAYSVKANFLGKKVTLTLKDAVLGPNAHSRIFKDRNLKKVSFAPGPGQTVEISLFLKNRNSRFFHLLRADPNQIVVDVKGENKPFLKTVIGKARPERVKVRGFTSADIAEVVQRDIEERLKSGRDDYQVALKAYQKGEYPQAVELFKEFRKNHPGSQFLSNLSYLHAEAEFKMAFRTPFPIYEKTITAYNFALREYPESKFYDHALSKLAFVYDELDFVLEAKSLYESGLKAHPKGLYSQFRNIQLALLMLRENRFEEAYDKLRVLLKVSPDDPQAQEGVFKIAKWYFDQENFPRSLEIYRDAIKRWPSYLNGHSEVNFFMGEMYFIEGEFPQARKHYFDLINLDPETPEALKSLNRIGDTYFMEDNDRAALAIFGKSAESKLPGREALYGKIRVADIGIRNPNLPVRDLIFDAESYFQPFKAYEEILKQAEDEEIIAQALLSRGIAFLREQRYLNAMAQFKEMLALNPKKRLAQQGKKFAKQALFLMVDRFSRQKGHLPILYAYADYLGLNLGDVNNAKTVLQIGESYQAIGMIQEAVHQYGRVKRLDFQKTFRDRIFLNLGRIHLEENKLEDAEGIARVFLNKFPNSNMLPEAMKLLAASLAGQKQFDEAIATYKDLLARDLADPSEVHYLLGEVYTQLSQRPEAIQSYQRVLETFDRGAETQPEYVAQAYFKHGMALYENNQFAAAVEFLDKARQLYPDHPLQEWAGFLIAEGHGELKEPKQARTELSRLAKSGKADDLLKQAAESKIKLMDSQKQFKDLL